MTFAAWDGQDFEELLAFDSPAPGVHRTRCADANANGRVYGGQILAQTLMAAAQGVPAGRTATAMQFMFLQGTLLDEAVQLQVTALQDGKRYSSRHVRGLQTQERQVLDAQVSFATAIDAPTHSVPPRVPLGDPESLPRFSQLPPRWSQRIERVLGYKLRKREALDFRLAAPPERLQLELPAPHLCFWVRMTGRLPDEPHVHAAAFAYLSDWWLNFSAVGGHQDEADARGGLYVASLNHAIWFHRSFRADQWLHFDSTSPAAASGRGLSIARVHDRAGAMVASVSQECLMTPQGRS